MEATEARFHEAMLGIYQRAKGECNYNATRFLQMVGERGGLEAARRLILSSEPSDGFTELWLQRRLDLTVEALVLQPRWKALFTEEELGAARKRLDELNFTPSGPDWDEA